MAIENYFYDEQLKRYLNQFAAIFDELLVKVGKNNTRDQGYIKVPIIHAPMDRVAAAAATGHTQNRHIKVPLMSIHLEDMQMALDRLKGVGVVTRQTYLPVGGILPDDGKVVYQRVSVPYDLTVNLYIYTSNDDQRFQILEQILVFFNPSLQIQTSDSALDPNRISTVQLTNISKEEQFPPGLENQLRVTVLTFKIDAYLAVPADVRDNLIKKIMLRISAVNNPNIGTIYSNGAENNSIGDIFDQLHIPVEIVADADDLPQI